VKMGSLQLANPMIPSSGAHGSSLGKVQDALKFGAGAAVTKSIGSEPREGRSAGQPQVPTS
ncbi:MAG TPA: hypothetical protein VKF39_00720, partial [Nitrososphaerales archaeon]|nr:hypothetical protein [Nitrososphaerales archaeon]